MGIKLHLPLIVAAVIGFIHPAMHMSVLTNETKDTQSQTSKNTEDQTAAQQSQIPYHAIHYLCVTAIHTVYPYDSIARKEQTPKKGEPNNDGTFPFMKLNKANMFFALSHLIQFILSPFLIFCHSTNLSFQYKWILSMVASHVAVHAVWHLAGGHCSHPHTFLAEPPPTLHGDETSSSLHLFPL